MPSPVDIRSLPLSGLQQFVQDSLDLPPFRARQIFSWIHGRGIATTDVMTDLSRDLRASLAGKISLAPLEVDAEALAEDGTRKLRLRCTDGALLETVLIPVEASSKITQCLSTQVGCGLGCRFCSTAGMGMIRNLSPGEIVDQVYRGRSLLAEGARISNLVFMGMGEPMNNLDAVLTAVEILCEDLGANFSPRRITISTAGVVPGIERMGRRARNVGLAVSLNATTDEVRSRLMPVNKRWPLAVLMKALRSYPLPRRRRITFEYVLIDGVNDSLADARRIPRLLHRIPAKVNLIPFNPGAGQALRRPHQDRVEAFAEILRDKNLNTHVRRSRGRDIAAACGQLAVEKK